MIRNARPEDFPAVRRLAETLDLDYPGMESDRFWLAEEAAGIRGIVALLRHPDCLELVSLGVAPEARSAGLGGRLIETLVASADGDVYLATVIPGLLRKTRIRPDGPGAPRPGQGSGLVRRLR